jgi:hypothetical protein
MTQAHKRPVPAVPSGELLDVVADILKRAAHETDLVTRADLLTRTRAAVEAFLGGELSADDAIAVLTELPSGPRPRRW